MTTLIPKTFELCGRKWTVETMGWEKYLEWAEGAQQPCQKCGHDPHKESKWHADAGCCSLAHHKIIVVPDIWGKDSEQTFYHELAHAIYYSMGFLDETDHPPEQVIDLLGSMLRQYDKTKKGEVDISND